MQSIGPGVQADAGAFLCTGQGLTQYRLRATIRLSRLGVLSTGLLFTYRLPGTVCRGDKQREHTMTGNFFADIFQAIVYWLILLLGAF